MPPSAILRTSLKLPRTRGGALSFERYRSSAARSCRPSGRWRELGMEHESKDITIIGAGPTGLFALFYAGMRGVSAQIVDALPEPGGQLSALYPEKFIFDVGGFPQILAKDLVKGLVEQAARGEQPMHFGERVVALEEGDGRFA